MDKFERCTLKDLVQYMKESGDDILKDNHRPSDVEFGILLGYIQILKAIQSSLTEKNELEELRLNFDVENYFLNRPVFKNPKK